MLLGPLRYQMLAKYIKFSNDIQQMTCVVIGKCHPVMPVTRQQWVIIRWNIISNINNYHPFEQSSAWRLESNAVKTCFFFAPGNVSGIQVFDIWNSICKLILTYSNACTCILGECIIFVLRKGHKDAIMMVQTSIALVVWRGIPTIVQTGKVESRLT